MIKILHTHVYFFCGHEVIAYILVLYLKYQHLLVVVEDGKLIEMSLAYGAPQVRFYPSKSIERELRC